MNWIKAIGIVLGFILLLVLYIAGLHYFLIPTIVTLVTGAIIGLVCMVKFDLDAETNRRPRK